MNEIILNWLPPAVKAWPSPSMSVLKNFLANNNTSSKIIYWNVLLDDLLKEYLFMDSEPEDEIGYLSLFYAYIAKMNNDESNLLKQEIILKSIKPQYRYKDSDYYRKHIDIYTEKLENLIKKIIIDSDLSNCLIFGMSMNLYQWIPSIVIAKLLKQLHPNIKICIGGIGNKNAAISYLSNFNDFDYAIWGEGEYPLQELINALKQKEVLSTVPHLIFRDQKNEITITSNKKCDYLDLNKPQHIDYSDFFQHANSNIKVEGIPIEGSRGCHWLKCKFCFLNEGYKYRTKEPTIIVNEIKYLINKYNIYKYQFLDNDIIGKDLHKFNELLDLLIQLKNEFPDFEIFLAEIITKGINEYYIKKMSLAGFKSVQIGYESPSNELLKKINKKNTFASNLFFIKWANIHSININGLNVLRGLLEETEENILEGSDNLYFLRFTLTKGYFQHNISQLAISKSSRYYKEVVNSNSYSCYNDIVTDFISKDIINQKDRDTILFSTKNKHSLYWRFFEKTENYFLENYFDYNLVEFDDKIIYTEYCNKNEINKLEFEKNSFHWKILNACNKEVTSINELNTLLGTNPSKIEDAINELTEEGLLYKTNDNLELVTVINTQNIIN